MYIYNQNMKLKLKLGNADIQNQKWKEFLDRNAHVMNLSIFYF